MAYREREEGGFLGGFPVGGCAGVAALFTSISSSILGPSIPVLYAAAGSGSSSLAIPCPCMLACVGIPLALFVPSGLWFVCLVAVASSLVACGSRPSVYRGRAPFRPSLHPVKYSLIPLMFRSSVLAASCSSRVSWQRPLSFWLWRLPPALMAILIPFRGVGGLLFFVCSLAVSTFTSAVAAYRVCKYRERRKGGGFFRCWARWRCMCLHSRWPLLCTSIPIVGCGDIYLGGHTSCSSCAPGCLSYLCFVAVVRPPVACGSLLLATYGCPSYHASFLRANGLECREHRMRT